MVGRVRRFIPDNLKRRHQLFVHNVLRLVPWAPTARHRRSAVLNDELDGQLNPVRFDHHVALLAHQP